MSDENGEFPPKTARSGERQKQLRNARAAEDVDGECDRFNQAVRRYVTRQCGETVNAMAHEADQPCSCGSGAAQSAAKVDLIILMDASGSMEPAVPAVVSAASAAIDAARAECGVDDLRTEWLVVDTTDDGFGQVPPAFSPTFTDTHERHLQVQGVSGPFQQNDPQGFSYGEEGADAIYDLAQHYDWREGACRAIFYISDTTLEGSGQPLPTQQIAVNRAITMCNATGVAVFAHFAEPYSGLTVPAADVEQTYLDLTGQTGGSAQIGGAPSEAMYQQLLQQAICDACGGCKSVAWPDIEPCISITWGQSDCDCMESDDTEKLCITVCNCYDNVTFTGVTIAYLWLTDENGNRPPTLPDGSPSSRIYPLGPLCFGDIGPCSEDGEDNCVSQEAVIVNRGVAPGKYQIHVGGLCFGIARHNFVERQIFEFEICQD